METKSLDVFGTQKKIKHITRKEFLKSCTQEGNPGATLLTGVKKLFPDDYDEVKKQYESIEFETNGIKRFLFLVGWLESHGVVSA